MSTTKNIDIKLLQKAENFYKIGKKENIKKTFVKICNDL